MNWIDEVSVKLKKKNQILFSRNSECMQDLIMLFETQSHQVMVLWASGKIKMRLAQRKILDCHAFAKEIENKEDIAICHSVGQACAVVHTDGHAIGYPIYDFTAIIYKYGIENCKDAVEQRKQEYIEKIIYWNEHQCGYQGTWTGFMLK